MMERKMKKMEGGKLALDLLIGLSIFLFTFIFVANFLPGVFADVRNEINLAHQAYRVSALLVEDPGFNSSWADDVNLMNCNSVEFRPGLMLMPMDPASGKYRKEYNHLNLNKIRKFAELLSNENCRNSIRKTLGLDLTDLGSPVSYKFNVSLRNLEGVPITFGGLTLLNHGDRGMGMQVLKFERIVYLDTIVDNCNLIANRCIAKLEVAVWI
ncbi:MAG: hypothetical protein NZ872_01955 [Archaeoglobaceae archaeon]|nr:hypothetical protein [Archaeoglobaceae archaeon]MDW8127962.1 hypothetical protein [Archaeoglobaceae archaeon]